MIDIVSSENGVDLGLFDTQTGRAANLLSIQIQTLEYADDWGIDLKYFLNEDFQFQNASFKAYLIERLANWGMNVAQLIDIVNGLFNQYIFELAPEETSTGFVAR